MEEHRCARCGDVGESVVKQECRTAYADERRNITPVLCPLCAEEYHDYWDSLWADYYANTR